MKRIFVAVDISEEARIRAAGSIENLRREFSDLRVGWEKPEKLHLTLKFLGETTDLQLEQLKSILEKAARNAFIFKLQIANTGVFPNARNTRVLWLDVIDEQGNLRAINQILEAECENIGFGREKRKFTPHLTIGRVREPNKSKELAKRHLETKFPPVEFEVSRLVIYESLLRPAGSIYQKIESFHLPAR